MIKAKPMQDQNLHKNQLYNTSVPTRKQEQTGMMIEQTNITTDNVVEVPHETVIIQKTSPRRTDTALHHEIENTLPQHYTRSRYDSYKRGSRSYRSPYRSHRSPYRRDSRPRYRSRSYSRDNIFTRYSSSYRPFSRPRNSRNSRSRRHFNTKNKGKRVQTQSQSDTIKFEIHMYHLTEMANALTPTS